MGLNIKKAIYDRGLDVKGVAKTMGITPVGLSQHINGNPSVDVLKRIADAIGCKVIDLFDDERLPVHPTNEFVCPKCGAKLIIKSQD